MTDKNNLVSIIVDALRYEMDRDLMYDLAFSYAGVLETDLTDEEWDIVYYKVVGTNPTAKTHIPTHTH